MDKYITDVVQVYLSIFFLNMLSKEFILGTILKKWIPSLEGTVL